MEYEKVEPEREGLSAFPETDTLYRMASGRFIRLRRTMKDQDGQIAVGVPDQGAIRTVDVKFQASLAKDATGDVRENAAGKHLLIPGTVRSVTLAALAEGKITWDAWLAREEGQILREADHTAYLLDQVYASVKFAPERPPEPSESVVKRPELEALAARVAALERL